MSAIVTSDIRSDWKKHLEHVVETVRNLSTHTDPQAMVKNYGDRMRKILPTDRMLALSRRDLPAPKFRITRDSQWKEVINPWQQKDRLPLMEGGLLGELIYGDQPKIINDLKLDAGDPAYPYLSDARSLMALPNYDDGVALNMVLLMRRQPNAFSFEDFPDLVLSSNLFGRATHNLVLSRQLVTAYREVDQELIAIANMQRSLLPDQLPEISTMALATHYETSRRAGGDYYDFFKLPNNKWGILIADVSGHGTPAAVMMAVTHSIAHSFPDPPCCPAKMLRYVNERLCRAYTTSGSTFVTAFYGVYDPDSRELNYACAGHNPPRVKRCADGSVFSLDAVGGLPMGIEESELYEPAKQTFQPGDQIIFYTDGITEAMNPEGKLFGLSRLDAAIADCNLYASGLIKSVLEAVDRFSQGRLADDDRTLLTAKIS
jgi:sigma-B regulation protein RsbU (phosphoserine phosphatase)